MPTRLGRSVAAADRGFRRLSTRRRARVPCRRCSRGGVRNIPAGGGTPHDGRAHPPLPGIHAEQHAAAVYGDVDIVGTDASLWPLAFPAFDYERMLEQGYCGYVFALRRTAALRAIESGAGNLYRVFNALLDDGLKAAENIVHLPGAIAALPSIDLDAAAQTLAPATQDHLKKRGADALITPRRVGVLPAVWIARKVGEARVTVVIPTRYRRELLEACIASIEPARHKREFDIVDSASSDPDALDHLSSIDGRRTRVVRAAGDLNVARPYNLASTRA